MRSALQKRIKAFYSAKEIAPFALNREEMAFSENMCRIELIFAGNSGKAVPGGTIRGRGGSGLEVENAGLQGRFSLTLSK
jgi:hypothetical protein